jgi:hypothetical protein
MVYRSVKREKGSENALSKILRQEQSKNLQYDVECLYSTTAGRSIGGK